MDHARKIGKQNKQQRIWPKTRDCRVPKPCCDATADEAPEEDHRLANWKRWMLDRQRRQNYLSTVLGRNTLDLALNAHEKVRSRNEARCLLQAAGRTEVTNQDKHRGNPAFWRTANRLVRGRELEDDVVGNLDRDAKNLPPDITRVALSNFIKKEKMLVEASVNPATINLASKWECGDYLHKRTSELQEEIQFIEAKRPEIDELIVTGRKFQCGDQKQNFIRVPVIMITPPDVSKKLLSDPDERTALKIQDREFVLEKGRHFERLSLEKSQQIQEAREDTIDKKHAYSVFEFDRVYKILPKKAKSITWSLTFQTQDSEICTRHLVLENRGVRIVNLHWRKEPMPFVPFPIPSRLDSSFFFNKNHLSILPGQKVEVPIWFHAKRPITATETWNLVVDPKIYPGTLHLRLWGVSCGHSWKHRQAMNFQKIQNHLRLKLRNSTIREIVDEIVLRATSERHLDDIPYDLFFLESEIFQARNPTYFYTSTLINELKEMFNETKSCTDDWNLSLAELRSILLKIDDPNVRRDRLARFQKICFECLRPTTIYTRPHCSKDQLVCRLLCACFNKFEDESNLVASRLCSQPTADYEDEESEVCLPDGNLLMHREVFYIRINCLLSKTLGRICTVIESYNYFNKKDIN